MAETFEVVVALVGRPWDPNPDAIDEDCGRPYQDRIKLSVEADATDSLRAVLAKAAARFAESDPGDYTDAGRSLAFYQGDPLEGVQLYIPATTTVTITSSEGLAIWHVSPEEASMLDLVLAEQRKVFKGDPLRPYLVVDPKWGMAGGVPGGWDTFVQIWGALLYIVGSIEVAKHGVRISKHGLELLARATDSWRRQRKAALYSRRLFEGRGADIMDVIGTASAVATYQIADIMAWTGIDDPAIAAEVAGWTGYRLDESSKLLSKDPDEDFVSLAVYLPTDMSIDGLSADDQKAHEEAIEALIAKLRDLGLTD